MTISKDLKTWVRNSANPILGNGHTGSFDERFASDRCILKYKREGAIFYYGLDRKGVACDLLAFSRSVVHVSKCKGALVAPRPKGTEGFIYVHKPSIIADRGTPYHFYCAVSHKYRYGISVVAS